MSPEYELLTKWIGAHATLEAARRELQKAEQIFNKNREAVAAVEQELFKLVPERGIRKILFQGQLIEISRKTGMGAVDSVYVTDVEEIKE